MPAIQSELDVNGEDFARNREAMLAAVAGFRELEQKVLDKAAEARPKFEKRGQLLPRERLALLLDPGAPFLELSSLAGYKLHDDKDGTQAGGGIIAGIGYIAGVRCLVSASNSAIKGGTISPTGLKKTLRLQQIAMENKLPVVTLTESGGANLNYAAEIFVEGARGFANQARISAMGIPQVTVVHGSSTAGGAYQPGLSDYVVVVRGKAKMFLAGPPLLKAATGEIASDEELGGAELHDCRRARRVPGANRCTRWRSCSGWFRPTRRSPTTSARSSRASPTAPSSSTSRTSSTARPSAATCASRATPAA